MRDAGRPAISCHSANASSSRVVHRDAQQRRIDRELARHQLPREADRVALEVVAEREVAQHLEERVMPRGVPDLLEIVVLAAGAHALLRRRRAPLAVRRVLHAEEDLLELDHPRVDEQQRGIVGRHERRAGPHDVLLAREVVEEAAANLGGEHRPEIYLGRALRGVADACDVAATFRRERRASACTAIVDFADDAGTAAGAAGLLHAGERSRRDRPSPRSCRRSTPSSGSRAPADGSSASSPTKRRRHSMRRSRRRRRVRFRSPGSRRSMRLRSTSSPPRATHPSTARRSVRHRSAGARERRVRSPARGPDRAGFTS